jgi:hypothetical protein
VTWLAFVTRKDESFVARRFKAKKEMEDFWQRRKQASSEDGIQGCGVISHVEVAPSPITEAKSSS